MDELQRELDIRPRTYRKYRKILQTEFPPLQNSDGETMVHEVKDGETTYLRLIEISSEESPRDPSAFTARVAAMHFSYKLLGFLDDTGVEEAIRDIMLDFEKGLHQRPFTLRHVLRNVDRLFYQLPDAPKDYSEKGDVISRLLHALVYTRRIQVRYSSAQFDGLTLDLEPLTLAVYRSALYLIARSVEHGDIRIYAVDRIEDVHRLDEKFDYPKPFEYSPDTYTEGSFGIYRSDDDEAKDFELVFDDERWLKLYLRERQWHPTQEFEELEDGRLRMTFTVNTDVEVWPWIRRFGEQVEVLQPPQTEEAAAD